MANGEPGDPMETTSSDRPRFTVEAIGLVHSPFGSQDGTPVQPALAGDDAVGTIEIFDPFVEGLTDIERFDRIWVLCWLDRSGPVRMRVIPYLDTVERGLFSTRSPNRPNPIGLSAVRLLRRAGGLLHVADLDLLDGTPVLDVKPYARRFDVFTNTRDGWLSDIESGAEVRADERFARED
jgi:tRNA-Thr(GGU) m(6)t(6)A37 methyltransferase TsaA